MILLFFPQMKMLLLTRNETSFAIGLNCSQEQDRDLNNSQHVLTSQYHLLRFSCKSNDSFLLYTIKFFRLLIFILFYCIGLNNCQEQFRELNHRQYVLANRQYFLRSNCMLIDYIRFNVMKLIIPANIHFILLYRAEHLPPTGAVSLHSSACTSTIPAFTPFQL